MSMKDSVHTKPDVGEVNLKYFKELYSANPNSQDLIESLASGEPLVVDHKSAPYSQIIHRSIDVKDLLVLKPANGAGHDANVLDSHGESRARLRTLRGMILTVRGTQI